MIKKFTKEKVKKEIHSRNFKVSKKISNQMLPASYGKHKLSQFNQQLSAIPSFDNLLPDGFDQSCEIPTNCPYLEQGNDSDRELRDEIERSITKSQNKSKSRISTDSMMKSISYPLPLYGSPDPKNSKFSEKDYVTFGSEKKSDYETVIKQPIAKSISDQTKPTVFKNGTFNLTEVLRQVNQEI